MFSVESPCSSSLARVGSLSCSRGGSFATPLPLLYTLRGTVPYVSVDFLARHGNVGLCLPVADMAKSPSKATLEALGGAHGFLNLEQHLLVTTLRDPLYHNTTGPCTADYVSVDSNSGRLKMTPKEYAELVAVLKPDYCGVLYDEPTNAVGKKRAAKAFERSLSLLDSTLSALKDAGSDVPVWGVVQGSREVALRAKSARDVSSRPVAGFILGGFGVGESAAERGPLLDAAIKNLPVDKPRMIHGLSLPEEILDGVTRGIDVFDCVLPYVLSQRGIALTFASTRDECELADVDYSLNLRDKHYVLDLTALRPGCSCFTCTHHTRAYIHHLLNTHEMLAETLLILHNNHHFLKFFESIRNAIRLGHFSDFCSFFLNKWAVVTPPVTEDEDSSTLAPSSSSSSSSSSTSSSSISLASTSTTTTTSPSVGVAAASVIVPSEATSL